MNKLIYISHEYGGKQENKDRIELIIKQLIQQYPDCIFISPVHCFGFLYDDVDYDTGMNYCLELLSKCDEMWICSEYSRGVLLEYNYCIEHGIEINHIVEDK